MDVQNKSFFERPSEEVAQDLIGKTLCYKTNNGQIMRYRIIETEAYYNKETFCYGHGKTKETSKHLKVASLFMDPGTWCVYGGLLLISVTNDTEPHNVLIRGIELCDDSNLKYDKPDKIANILKLYKTHNKIKVEGHKDFSGIYSFNSDELYFENGTTCASNKSKRVNIKDDSELNFRIK